MNKLMILIAGFALAIPQAQAGGFMDGLLSGIAGAAQAGADIGQRQMDSDREFERQKALMEYQHKLEMERIDRERGVTPALTQQQHASNRNSYQPNSKQRDEHCAVNAECIGDNLCSEKSNTCIQTVRYLKEIEHRN